MATLKRTLTEKSILWFGKYQDRSIQQVIDLRNTGYLRWLYFNNSIIDFNETLKTRLGINGEWEIPKPGKNPEMYDKHVIVLSAISNARYFNQHKQTDEAKAGFMYASCKKAAAVRRKRKSYAIMIDGQNSRSFKGTKSFLQAHNHGHV